MRIDFYHLGKTSIDIALPSILEKIMSTGKKTILRTDLPERVDYFNNLLWTQNPASFIPHGTAKESHADKQPLYITDKCSDFPNSADFLILIDNESIQQDDNFERIFYLFNGLDSTSVTKARQQWKEMTILGYNNLHYWQQTPQGKWQEEGLTKPSG